MLAYDKNVVLKSCIGKYDILMEKFFPELQGALKTPGKHVPNPYKSGSKDGFRVFRDFKEKGNLIFNTLGEYSGRSISLIKLFEVTGRSSSFNDTLEKVGSFLNCPRTGKHLRGTPKEDNESTKVDSKILKELEEKATLLQKKAELQAKRRLKMAQQKIQREEEYLQPLDLDNPKHKFVLNYFKNRGLDKIRFSPNSLANLFVNEKCPYYEDNKLKGYYPALVAKVQDENGKIWTYHRTYLTLEGKKAFDSAKKMMSMQYQYQQNSLSINLGTPYDGVIGVAEGIETALSVQCALGIPCWSTISASFMVNFIPPKGVKGVVVFADNDVTATGKKAAQTLVAKLKARGLKAVWVQPKSNDNQSLDWNDVLIEKGIFGFPNPKIIWDLVRQ